MDNIDRNTEYPPTRDLTEEDMLRKVVLVVDIMVEACTVVGDTGEDLWVWECRSWVDWPGECYWEVRWEGDLVGDTVEGIMEGEEMAVEVVTAVEGVNRLPSLYYHSSLPFFLSIQLCSVYELHSVTLSSVNPQRSVKRYNNLIPSKLDKMLKRSIPPRRKRKRPQTLQRD